MGTFRKLDEKNYNVKLKLGHLEIWMRKITTLN